VGAAPDFFEKNNLCMKLPSARFLLPFLPDRPEQEASNRLIRRQDLSPEQKNAGLA
jgi:hypothetical protein